MRHAALIVVVISGLLFLALYGAITVVYARVSRGIGISLRYSNRLPSPSGLYVHDVFIELPGGIRVTGNGREAGTLAWGFLKLPVSQRQNVGQLLMFTASMGGVALGAYVWRERILDYFR